jgi:hypothetical protein
MSWNYSMSIIGPRIHTRTIEEEDWEKLKSIFGTYKDFELTDEEAKSLCKIWSRNTKLCVWPITDSTDMESTQLLCLNTDNTPVGFVRCNYSGTTTRVLMIMIDEAHSRENYYTEAAQFLAKACWECLGAYKIEVELKTNISTYSHSVRQSLEVSNTRLGEGLKAEEWKKTTQTRADWEQWIASEHYVPLSYSMSEETL